MIPVYGELIGVLKVKNYLSGCFNLDIQLKNIKINGATKGCSGFITNKDNGRVLYINTEYTPNLGYLYRFAKDTRDYTGMINRYAKTKIELFRAILRLLEEQDIKIY